MSAKSGSPVATNDEASGEQARTAEQGNGSTTTRPGRRQLFAAVVELIDPAPVTFIIIDNPADTERYQLLTVFRPSGAGEDAIDRWERRAHAMARGAGATVIGRLDGEDELEAFCSRSRRGGVA